MFVVCVYYKTDGPVFYTILRVKTIGKTRRARDVDRAARRGRKKTDWKRFR